MQEKILIVDTDEGTYKYLALRLSKYGFAIQYLSDSLEAIELLQKSPLDLAIIDTGMPEINGVTLLKRFKEIDPKIQVLMMGNEDNAWQAMGALKYKAADFLQKPFGDFNDIWASIERALKEKRLAAENEKLLKELEKSNQNLTVKVKEKTKNLEELNLLMLEYTEELTSVIQGITNLQMTIDLEQVVEKVLEGLKKNFNISKASLLLCDQEKKSILSGKAIGLDSNSLDLNDKDLLLAVQEVMKTNRSINMNDFNGKWGSGERIFGEWTIFPLKARNEILGVIVTQILNQEKLDIIRIYNNMVTLAISNSVLYEEVQKHGKELKAKKDELEKANMQLQELDAMKTSFMNMVVHDIRTPLTSINAYADLMLRYKDKPQETKDEFARIIKSECGRLESLVSNFLNIEKIESGHIKFNFEAVDIVKLLEHFTSVFKANADSKKIQLSLNCEEGVPMVRVDKESIGQVVTNLFSNAIKFTPEDGEISVNVKTLSGFVEVSFVDTGPGIPKEMLSKIFNKFIQAHEKSVKGGTGLGLAIAKNIIMKHGGEMGVESEVAKGSRFYFTVGVFKEE